MLLLLEVCEGVHSFYVVYLRYKYSVLSRTKYSAHSRFLAESFQGRDDIIGAHRWWDEGLQEIYQVKYGVRMEYYYGVVSTSLLVSRARLVTFSNQ
jgi:hypothetical protein